MINILKGVMVAFALVLVSGCSTMLNDKVDTVVVTSEPAGADFVVRNKRGEIVASGVTPHSVVLKKSTGKYMEGEAFTVAVSKPGYVPGHTTIGTHISPVATTNILNGFLGFFIVDPFNGGMWELNNERPTVVLEPIY